jgi:hypothetical protein
VPLHLWAHWLNSSALKSRADCAGALFKEVDEQNRNAPPLSDEEIVAEVKAVRKEMKAKVVVKAVIDTNVWIGALYSHIGVPHLNSEER